MVKSQVLKTVNEIDVSGKKVLARLDLDVPLSEVGDRKSEVGVADDTRLVNTLATIKYLLDKQAKVTIIGHLGRPLSISKFKVQSSKFSMEPVRNWYRERLKGYQNWELWENLRFDPGEETNSQSFAEDIVRRSGADIYVFEAFATSHEPHASIISVPKLVAATAVGFRFAAEIRNLEKIWQSPKRPVVFVLGGAKLSTKLPLVEKLTETADTVLLGGLFPAQVQKSEVRSQKSEVNMAELNEDGLDISEKSAQEFADIIMRAGTVVWNGPMGALEKGAAAGTELVAKAVRETAAFTVAGGGDTEAALTKLGGSEGIDWISSGGGAMLYYLAHRTLPFLEAISDKS